MAQQTFTGRKRVRKFFGHIREVAEMPNLIEVQKASYDQFLMVAEPPGGRPDEGLQAVFRSVFPISDFSNASMLEFVRYEFEPPKYDVDECRQRGMTYAAPLKVTLQHLVTVTGDNDHESTLTSQLGTELRWLVQHALSGDLAKLPKFAEAPELTRVIRDIAFSGDGEPTMVHNFDACVQVAVDIKLEFDLKDTRIVLITDAAGLDKE